jgi:hypothetical protein
MNTKKNIISNRNQHWKVRMFSEQVEHRSGTFLQEKMSEHYVFSGHLRRIKNVSQWMRKTTWERQTLFPMYALQKRLVMFPSPVGMSLTKRSLAGKSLTFFLKVRVQSLHQIPTITTLQYSSFKSQLYLH